jgi:hypothetical protein
MTTGRRRPDTDVSDLPDDIQPGDYWRVLFEGAPWHVAHESNLTHEVWMVVAPETGFGPAMLARHTVREEDDGTISVRAGDGSSNSILVTGGEWSSV